MEAYVAPYVQVRHAIHLLYATSPYSRDGEDDSERQVGETVNDRLDPTWDDRERGSRGDDIR
jgi:hypothetical protein